jgi:hypothetical protein
MYSSQLKVILVQGPPTFGDVRFSVETLDGLAGENLM